MKGFLRTTTAVGLIIFSVGLATVIDYLEEFSLTMQGKKEFRVTVPIDSLESPNAAKTLYMEFAKSVNDEITRDGESATVTVSTSNGNRFRVEHRPTVSAFRPGQ